jgi:hypothetical protein
MKAKRMDGGVVEYLLIQNEVTGAPGGGLKKPWQGIQVRLGPPPPGSPVTCLEEGRNPQTLAV